MDAVGCARRCVVPLLGLLNHVKEGLQLLTNEVVHDDGGLANKLIQKLVSGFSGLVNLLTLGGKLDFAWCSRLDHVQKTLIGVNNLVLILVEDRCKQELFEDLINQVLLSHNFFTQLFVNFGNNLASQKNKANHQVLFVMSLLLSSNFIDLILCFRIGRLFLVSTNFINNFAEQIFSVEEILLSDALLLLSEMHVSQFVKKIEELSAGVLTNLVEIL